MSVEFHFNRASRSRQPLEAPDGQPLEAPDGQPLEAPDSQPLEAPDGPQGRAS